MLKEIGSTETLHIFISNRIGDAKAVTTGGPVAGYKSRIADSDMHYQSTRSNKDLKAVDGSLT